MHQKLRNIFNLTALGFIAFAFMTSVIFCMGASDKASGLELTSLLLSPLLATGLVIAGLYQLASSLSPPKDSKKTTRAIGLMLASIPLMGLGLWQFNAISASPSRVLALVEQGRLEHAQNTTVSLLFTHGAWSGHKTLDEYFDDDADTAVYARIFKREPALKQALSALAKARMSRCGPKGPDQHCATSSAIMAKLAAPQDPALLKQAIKLMSDCHAACPHTPKVCLPAKRAALLNDFKLDTKGRTLACQAAALTTMHKLNPEDASYHLLRLDYSQGYAKEALEALSKRLKDATTLAKHARALAEPAATLTKNYSSTVLAGTPEHDAIAHGLRVAQRAALELPPLLNQSSDYIKFTLEARKMASLEIHKHLWIIFNQDDAPFMALRFQGDEAQGALLLPPLGEPLATATPLDEWVGWMTKQALELPEGDLGAKRALMIGDYALSAWRDPEGKLARAVLGKVPIELEHLTWSWAANHAALQERFNQQLEQQLTKSQLSSQERERYKRRNQEHFQTHYYSDTHRATGIFIAPLILPSRGYAAPSAVSRSASRSSSSSTSSRSSSTTSRYSSSPSQRRSTTTSSSRSGSYSSRSRSGYRSGSYSSGK